MKNRRIFVMTAVVVVAASLIYASMSYLTGKKPCLTAADYRDLTGETAPLLTPGESFYTFGVSFEDDREATVANQKTYETIGGFYKDHGNKSIQLTLNSQNNKATVSEERATERLRSVKQALVSSGVKESAITVETPQLIDAEPDSPDAGTITITSDKECSV